MDVGTGLAAVHSVWLLPVLVVLIAVDAPLPVLPSETILMTAAALAFADRNAAVLVGLFVAALVGSAAGDLITFGLGRSSHRLVAGRAEDGLAGWVRRHMVRRPGIALVGARFLPGGRLVSTAAAGRFGVPLRRFLPWSLVSSAVWSAYMLGVGRVLQPMTGGNPLLCVLGGTVLAVLTGLLFAVGQHVVVRRARLAA